MEKREKKLVIATDGSMYPADAKIGDRRLVSAAFITNDGKKVGAVVKNGQAAVVMHGELLGVVMALVQGRLGKADGLTIHTDYLHTVRRIKRFREQGVVEGNSWYRWIFKLWKELEEDGMALDIHHVRAHVNADEATTEEKLNQLADDAAREARTTPSLNHSPWPTFEMEEYAPYQALDGSYIEMDLYQWVKSGCLIQRTKNIKIRYPSRFDLSCYERNVTDKEYYTKSMRDYSIRTQALTRGHALMTNARTHAIFPDSETIGPLCPHCPNEAETDHHIFVTCHRYEMERADRINQLQKYIDKHFPNGERTQTLALRLFSDSDLWPGNYTQYYLGLVPRLELPDLPATANQRGSPRSTITKHIHSELIKATGYLWSLRMKAKFDIAHNLETNRLTS